MDCLAEQLRKRLEPHQLSVRTPGAVEALTRCLRQWCVDAPSCTLVQLDLSNAYGAVKRSAALAAVREICPGLAPLLAGQWQVGAAHAWAHDGEQWQWIAVDRRTWQGAPASNPAFCCASSIALSEVLGNLPSDPGMDPGSTAGADCDRVDVGSRPDGDADSINNWDVALAAPSPNLDAAGAESNHPLDDQHLAWAGYADDTFLFGDALSILLVWENIRASFAAIGLQLNDDKSTAYTGRYDRPGAAGGELDDGTKALYSTIPRAQSPPRILGAVLTGSARVGIRNTPQTRGSDLPARAECSELAREALIRGDQAAALCSAIREISSRCGELRGCPLEAAWQLLSKCAAHALDFDERLCPAGDISPAASRLEGRLVRPWLHSWGGL